MDRPVPMQGQPSKGVGRGCCGEASQRSRVNLCRRERWEQNKMLRQDLAGVQIVLFFNGY